LSNVGILVASYTESQVSVLFREGAIKQVQAVAFAGKWRLLFFTETMQVTLIAEKSKMPRNFASLDTVASWLRERLGNVKFYVDMTYWAGLPA